MGAKSAHIITATAYLPGAETVIPLSVIEASVTLDENWSPFIQGQLTCWAPDAETLALLDPRLDTRLTLTLRQEFGITKKIRDLNIQYAGLTIGEVNAIWAGKTIRDMNRAYSIGWNSYGFRSAETFTVDVSMRSRTIDYEAGTVSFQLASDEALLEDFALASTAATGPGGTSMKAAVIYALAKIGATLTDGLDATVEAESLVWQPGVSAMDYLEPALQVAGLRLYCDEKRRWHLVNPVFNAPGSLRLSGEQTITRAEQSVSRDAEWFDAVVIRYSWTDEFDLAVTALDVAGEPGYSKVLTIEYKTPYPGPGAAQAVLNKATGRGRTFDVTAVSDYKARPGMSLVLTLPDTPIQTGVVSSVTWTFPADEMTVGSRGLVDTVPEAWLFAPEAYGWTDSPIGTSWADYQPEPV